MVAKHWKPIFRRVLIAGVALASAPAGSFGGPTSGLKPILGLDAAGHTGWVSRLLLTPDYRLISTAHDKTIRFWDLRSGEPSKVWRPAIDRGESGRINTAALSPDGHLLAFAGQSALVPAGEQVILLVDMQQDTVVHSLRAASGTIRDLEFSPDGRWLAASGDDAAVRLWDARSGELTRIFYGHTNRIYCLGFSPDGRRLVSGSWDGTSRIWSVPDGTEVAVLAGQARDILRVAWSPDGRTIATGGSGPTIWLWEPDGRLRYECNDFAPGLGHDVSTAVSLLVFSPDSRSLLAGWGSRMHPDASAVLLDMADGHVRYRVPGVPSTPMCGLFLPNGQFGVGFSSGDIWFCSASDRRGVHSLRSRAAGHYAVGWSPDGRAIAWGNTKTIGSTIEGTCPLERAFCLETLAFAPPPDATFQRSLGELAGLSLERVKNSVVRIDQAGVPVADFTIPETDDRVRCRSLLSQGRGVVGSQHGVYVFEAASGRPICQLPGHTDTVWCLAPSPDGRFLLTGSADMTLEIWNLDRYELAVSLFVAGDEWIAWTPQGYYAASIGGERLMGWHVNRGPEELADFYPAAQFRDQFYRPDLIRRVLQTGDPSSAMATADADGTRVSRALTIAAAIPPEVHTRLVESAGHLPAGAEFDGTIHLSATATRRGSEPILGLQLIVDGRPAEFRPSSSGEPARQPMPPDSFEASWELKLPPGEHSLVVQAQTAASFQLSKPVTVRIPGAVAAGPNLYILSIAAGDGDQSSPQSPFAETDAASLAEILAHNGGKLYGKVEARTLAGSQATAANLARELAWLRVSARAEDVAIVFFAGRASADDRGQVLLLAPGGGTPMSTLLIAGDDLKDSLRATHGHVFFWTDARWSGAKRPVVPQRASAHDYCCGDAGVPRPSMAETRSSRALDDFLRELARPENGVASLAAATGRETAQDDGQQRHGLLNLALGEALSGHADTDRDGQITWTELQQFLARALAARSRGQQHPVIATPILMPVTTLVRP